MLAPVDNVETPDPHTAVLRMSRPHPAILPGHVAGADAGAAHIYGDGDLKSHPRNGRSLAGPYRLEFKPGQECAERFDKFFLPGKPYLDRVVVKINRTPPTC